MATPGVLITSCFEFPPENIVKGILKVNTLQKGKPVIESIVKYDWRIETKYYSASVCLCVTKDRTIGNKEFAESVQAFIVCFDAEKRESFGSVKLWSAYLKEIDPEIKMLVCDRCTDSTVVGRLEAQTWCIDNGFELIELNPEPLNSDSDLEDDFVETTGLDRIVQSLHAHTWPNLTLKESGHSVSPFIRQLMKEELESRQLENSSCDLSSTLGSNVCDTDLSDNVKEQVYLSETVDVSSGHCSKSDSNVMNQPCDHSACETKFNQNTGITCDICKTGTCTECGCGVETKETGDRAPQDRRAVPNGAFGDSTDEKTDESKKAAKKTKQPSKQDQLDSLLPAEDMSLFEAIGDNDPGGESFEKLFERFAKMKERANGLPFEERKKYAENVAIAFWKAIGGDEEEIGDLDSDS